MDQIPQVVGQLQWLLSRSRKEIRERALELSNCATRIRLSTLNPEAWTLENSDAIRTRLRTLVDALANAALRVHLDNRDARQPDSRLTATLMTGARAVIEFVHKSGFTVPAKEHPASSTPPTLTEIWSAISQLPPDADAFPALPDQYVQDIAGGLLDVFASASHQSGESGSGTPSGIGRTMNNTGAAALELAQDDHAKGAIPASLRQHDRLAAKVLWQRVEDEVP